MSLTRPIDSTMNRDSEICRHSEKKQEVYLERQEQVDEGYHS